MKCRLANIGALALAGPPTMARCYATPSTDFGKQHICRGIGRMSDMVVTHGKGSFVWNDKGEKFLDFTTGIGVANLGHTHPRVVKAAQEQLTKITHSQVNLSFHQPMLQLIQRLQPKLPKELDTFFFWNSGAEAVEAAVKLARHATKRPNMVVMQGSYHGRTIGTMSMTTSKTIYSAGFQPLMPGVYVTPFPYYKQLGMPKDTAEEVLVAHCLKAFEELLLQGTAPSDTGLVIMESTLGEGGYIEAPAAYITGMQEICKKHGILFCIDDVQAGFGRCGSLFSHERVPGLVPDIVVFAKGIANGLPLSGIVSTKELMDRQPPGSMGGTYAGNAVSCAAALAVLDAFEQDGVFANIQARRDQLLTGLHAIKTKHNLPIEDIRGPGLMIGVQFSDEAPAGIAKNVCNVALSHSMMMLTCSIYEVMRLIPPLTITEEEMGQALEIIEKSMVAAMKM